MADIDFARVLSSYAEHFGQLPPSILTDDGAKELMLAAIERGSAITGQDLVAGYESKPA